MTPLKANKHSRSTKTPSPKPSHQVSPAPRKIRDSPATSRNPSATPQPTQPQRKSSATPKPNPSPQPTQPRKLSATPLQPAPRRKSSATPKPPSPPKPNWIAPPGKHYSPSPTQIPLPVFVSSVRKKNFTSPLQVGSEVERNEDEGLHIVRGIGGLCTPVSAPKRRRSGVAKMKMGSPLVYQIGGVEDTCPLITKESGHEEKKKEIQGLGLGLSFKDPFSSTLGSGSGSGSGIMSAVSGIPVSGQTTPRVKSFGDVGEAASPISPNPRIYTPTTASTTFSATTRKQQEKDAEGTPKRDSLSPDGTSSFSPTSVPSTIAIPATRPSSSSKPFSRIPHLRTPPSTLPPSPSRIHPYTGNVHITPSCTSGSLTHRLICGHLVVTERVEVCGRNCGCSEEKENGRIGRGKEQDFVANIRDLDQVWGCPCCGSGGGEICGKGKGKWRKCVAMLDVEVGGYGERRMRREV